jgi:hypothetical protein
VVGVPVSGWKWPGPEPTALQLKFWAEWVRDGEALRYKNPADSGQIGSTYVEGNDLIVRPSTGIADAASVFVGHNLMHVPKDEAPRVAATLLKAAGWAVSTVEELDALPDWSVVMHAYGDGSRSVWVKERGRWFASGCLSPDEPLEILLEEDETVHVSVLSVGEPE